MTDLYYDEDDDEEDILFPSDFEMPENPPPKKKTGRPKGQTLETVTSNNLRSLYKRVDSHLTPQHRDYMDKVLSGKAEVDPVRELQLLVRYLALLCFTAVEWALEDRKISQPTVALLDAHRMALKDLEDMQRRRRDEEFKKNDDNTMVDPTRPSNLESFIEVHSGIAA